MQPPRSLANWSPPRIFGSTRISPGIMRTRTILLRSAFRPIGQRIRQVQRHSSPDHGRMKLTVPKPMERLPRFGDLPTLTARPATASGQPQEEMFRRMDDSSCLHPTGKTNSVKLQMPTNTGPTFSLFSYAEPLQCSNVVDIAYPSGGDD